ncbi:hypothetical protein Unana1_06636 [Umbelopsis nana]
MSGGGNGEFQSYTNNRTNSFVEDGVLYLKPTFTANLIGEEKMKSGGKISLWGNDETSCTDNAAGGCERESSGDQGGLYLNPIQSAKIKLDKSLSVSYGKVEVNARMPKGDWVWPAIWLMPKNSMYGAWPASGEIDIVETRGNVNYTFGNVTSAASTLQWGPSMDLNAYLDTHVEVLVDNGKSFADNFHTWGLEWDEDGLRTYVDNTTLLQVHFDKPFWERHEFPNWATNPWKGGDIGAPFDQEFFLIMNVAVGGTNGYFPDAKDKPWKNADPRAVNKFWDRRKYWQPSWGSGNQAALAWHPEYGLDAEDIDRMGRDQMEEISITESVTSSILQADDQSGVTTVVSEEHVTIDQTEMVDQPMEQQYSKYHIYISQAFDLRASTESLYSKEDTFFKSCKWSPDGSCILTNSNDNVARVFLPSAELFSEQQDGGQVAEILRAKEAEPIYECCWYPLMNIQDPATCCFLTSSRDHPVHLWDSNTGELRASYSVIDHRERYMGAIGLTFDLDGSNIYCGYENMIQVFDTSRPGQAIQKISTTPTRKSRNGQKGDTLGALGYIYQVLTYADNPQGIISCLAFSPDYSGLLAAGTYSLTNQRISFDIDSAGQALATGSANGDIRLFDISTISEGGKLIQPSEIMSPSHDDLVSAVSFNPLYPILASCSGQRKFNLAYHESEDEEDDPQSIDNSLKLWHVPGTWETYDIQQMQTENI